MSSFAPRHSSWPGFRFAMTTTLSRLHRPTFRRLPALLLLAAVAACAGLTPAHAELRMHDLWWAPEAVTEGGHEIDRMMIFIMWLTTAVFIATQVVYVYFLIKYRYRKGVKAVYSHGNNALEIVWTTIPALIFLALAVLSDRLWLQLRSAAPKDALTIDLVAYQFGFHIRNPGKDGHLGSYAQEWMEKGTNNFGTDPTKDDPAGHDDYQSENQITLPVGRPVNVILRSQDVIHAFYVPEFRMYQDILPGRIINWVWFTPEKVGHYALACNQLCGAGHYNMQAPIDVVSAEDYDKLVSEKTAKAVNDWQQKNAPKPTGASNDPVTASAPVAVAARH